MTQLESRMKITDQMRSSVPFQYAEGVRSGSVIAGEKIRRAVDRFYQWIEDADRDGFYLNHAHGMHVIEFFPRFLKHTKGKSAGESFHLSPYQQFTLYNVFGWKQISGDGREVRRISEIYEKVAKKNGKTAVMAGVSLYHLAFDDEAGAEVYVAATKEAQARLCWDQARDFINASPALRSIGFRAYQRIIKFKRPQDPAASQMFFLGGDSKTHDGLNCSLAVQDEYHAVRDDSVKENLESSMASRRQPIIYHITTAGVNLASVCKNYEEMCEEVLEGTIRNDHLLIMIHDLDQGDDWEDPQNWRKANPNFGITVGEEFLRKEYDKAKNQPSKIPNFKTKHLNMWVDAPEIWIPSEIWRSCTAEADDYEALFHEKAQEFGCYSATDLSTTKDLSAHVLITEPDLEGIRYVLPFLFCPAEQIDIRSKEDRVPYRLWRDQGHLIATEGNVIDYDVLTDKIRETNGKYNVIHHEFDKWNSHAIINALAKDGITNCSLYGQYIGDMSPPSKELERLLYKGEIRHDGNPVMEWNLSGCVLQTDGNENFKIHKGNSHKSRKRVDGIVALIMALGGSISQEKEETNESKYNDPNHQIKVGIS